MTTIADPTMSYEGLVEAGRAAREQADDMQWVEGDLALKVEVLPLDERPRDPETGAFIEDESKTLKRYAEDVGLSFRMTREYRRVAAAWLSPTRTTSCSWEVYRLLAAQEDRFALIADGMTVRQAEKLVRDRTAGAKGKPAWLELLGKSADQMIAAGKTLAKLEAEIDAKGEKAKVTAKMAEKASRYRGVALDMAARYEAIRDAR